MFFLQPCLSPRPTLSLCVCVCVCVCLSQSVSVVSVIVKRPVLPPCVVDGRSRLNPLYYYYYYFDDRPRCSCLADAMARNDYSWSETALNFWATLTLAVMAVTSFLLRYVTDPVTCFTPAQFVASHNAYTRQVCYDTQRIFSTATLVG